MGLDGFSMGNLGLNADMTSAQMANQVEHLANKESKFKIKDVEESVKEQGIKRKEEDEENQNQFNEGFEKKKEEEEDKKNEVQTKSFLTEKDFDGRDPKEFAVRINPKTELVELFSNRDNKILETISAPDLMELISKLDSASGVLVNRKI